MLRAAAGTLLGALALLAALPSWTAAASCPAWTLNISGGKRQRSSAGPSITAGKRTKFTLTLYNPGADTVVNATVTFSMDPGMVYAGDASAVNAKQPRHMGEGKGVLILKDPSDMLWLHVNMKPRSTRKFRVKAKISPCMPPKALVGATAFFDLDDGTPVHIQDCLVTDVLELNVKKGLPSPEDCIKPVGTDEVFMVGPTDEMPIQPPAWLSATEEMWGFRRLSSSSSPVEAASNPTYTQDDTVWEHRGANIMMQNLCGPEFGKPYPRCVNDKDHFNNLRISSPGGQYIYAVTDGYLGPRGESPSGGSSWYSRNYGINFVGQYFLENRGSNKAKATASEDGRIVILGPGFRTDFEVSQDHGVHYQEKDNTGLYEAYALACNVDCSVLVAAHMSKGIYISTDLASSFRRIYEGQGQSGYQNWWDIAISRDGQVIVAVQEQAKGISISRDGGANWVVAYEDATNHNFRRVACDGNCQTIAVTQYATGRLHLSKDGGRNWVTRISDKSLGLWAVAMSAAGDKILVSDYYNRILYSKDGGDSWAYFEKTYHLRKYWFGFTTLAISADGCVAGLGMEYHVGATYWPDSLFYFANLCA